MACFGSGVCLALTDVEVLMVHKHKRTLSVSWGSQSSSTEQVQTGNPYLRKVKGRWSGTAAFKSKLRTGVLLTGSRHTTALPAVHSVAAHRADGSKLEKNPASATHAAPSYQGKAMSYFHVVLSMIYWLDSS